jgi:hypothetical protein
MKRSAAVGVAVLGAACAVVGDSPAVEAAKARADRVLDRGSASGDFAIAQASGTQRGSGPVTLIVRSKPRQRVQATWVLVCTQGSGAGSRDGQFTARTPIRRRLRKPGRGSRDCIASANAQLNGSGRVTVILRG